MIDAPLVEQVTRVLTCWENQRSRWSLVIGQELEILPLPSLSFKGFQLAARISNKRILD
ncbi:hypothetical protein [uncultured Nostoc sp.]|uniref:hypothetical protein n=1 Tax=uncultured Nostoc sp. TaxID=340711 RepID=UPI0035CB6C15